MILPWTLLFVGTGTQTLLMDVRWFDKSKLGLRLWVVDTVHLWGESPEGLWSIVFYDTVSYFVAELSYSSDI